MVSHARKDRSEASRLDPKQAGNFAWTAREVRYKILRMMGANRWETLRGIFTNRDHLWYGLLENEEDELFRELSLALVYVVLGETQNAKRYLEQILRLSHEDARAQLLYAYVNLIENNSEQALVRYTQLLDHKEFRSRVQGILGALKNTQSAYMLTLSKPLKFFYVHYDRTWGDAFYYYTRSLFRNRRSPWSWFWGIVLLGILGGWGMLINFGFVSGFQRWLKHTVYIWKLPTADPNERLLQELTFDTTAVQETTPTSFNAAYYEQRFNEMKQAIGASAPNAALFAYNTTMEQRPPLVVSEKFAILKTFVPIPQITSFENTISFADIMKTPEFYIDTYWKLEGEVLAPRKFDDLAEVNRSKVLQQVLSTSKNNIVFSFVVREGPVTREIVEVFFHTATVFPKAGEHYEILMSFMGLGERRRPYMQGIVMRRLKG